MVTFAIRCCLYYFGAAESACFELLFFDYFSGLLVIVWF